MRRVSRRGSAARNGVLAFAGVLLVAAIVLALPWGTQSRDRIASVPVAPDLERVSLVRLAPGTAACTAPVVFGPAAARAVFTTRATSAGAPPLRVTATAAGYRQSARVPAGGPGRAVQTATISPARRDVAGRLCIANSGKGAVSLEASKSPRRATTRVDGRPAGAAVVLTLLERRRSALASRLHSISDHVAAFRPSFVGPVFLALLALVVLALLVLGLPWALGRALDGDDQERERPGLRRNAGSSISRQDPNASA